MNLSKKTYAGNKYREEKVNLEVYKEILKGDYSK